MDAAQKLVAIEEIKAVKARYFRHMDERTWDGWDTVFAPDAVMDMTEELARHGADDSATTVFTGRDSIREFVSGSLVGATTVHHGHMPEITIVDEDHATGIWAMEDFVDFNGFGLRGYGHYHEEYTRVDGSWFISFLKLTRLRVDVLSGE